VTTIHTASFWHRMLNNSGNAKPNCISVAIPAGDFEALMKAFLTMRVQPLSLFLLLAGTGCHPPYHRPPKPGRPSATVKFRVFVAPSPPRSYVPIGGTVQRTWPSNRIFIDGRLLKSRGTAIVAGKAAATWTRVQPGWRTFEQQTWWSLSYQKQVETEYYETKTETCWKYKCRSSYGTHGYENKCGNQMETCTKRVRKTRLEWRTFVDTFGRCTSAAQFWMRNKGIYLLDITYLGPSRCRLTCHEQIFLKNGAFRVVPCTANYKQRHSK